MHRLPLALLSFFTLPVIASYYYGGIQDPVWIISAFLSILAFAYCVPITMGLVPAGSVRLGAALVFVYCVAVYLFAEYLSYFFQGSYLNRQFFFHFNLSTLIETWDTYYPMALMFGVWVLALFVAVYFLRHSVTTKQYSIYQFVALVSLALLLDPGIRQAMGNSMRTDNYTRIESFSDIEWEALGFNQAALDRTQLQASPGKNLVLIYLEGLESIYQDEGVFPGLTPNLQRLNEEGWLLHDFLPVQGSMWTMGGIVTTLCSTPLESQSLLGGNQIMFSDFLDLANCLPDVLASAGYQQVFMGGASLDFAGKGNFFETHSYNRVLGKEELESRLSDPGYLGSWGLYDDSLFDLALEEFNNLAAADKPFNLTLLTVDTHHPAGERSASCGMYPELDNSMLHAVHCTDYLLGKFISRLKTHEAFEDTIVVITSDHLAMQNSAWSEFPRNRERTLYFNALNTPVPPIEAEDARPMDLAPTILQLMEVKHNAAFLAGRNLLEPQDSARTYNPDHPYSRAVLAFLNSQHLSSRASDILYSLEEDGISGIEFSDHVTDIEFEDGVLSFEATGNDPYLILPQIAISDPQETTLFLSMSTEQDSIAAIYYSPGSQAEFSEENTLLLASFEGENGLAFALGDLNNQSRIRIDPGTHEGHYELEVIEIQY